jgi:predicted short-subunit dehydrogenase-like oxidoreductase (DUF2520 family)
MRAWDEADAAVRRQTEARAEEDAARLAELEAHGIDLDPSSAHPGPGAGPDTDGGHDDAEAGARPVVGIVGAGHVGTALGVALHRAGWPIGAVASRDAGRRERFRSLVPGARGFAEASALVDDVDLVLLAVPDDAVGPLAATLRLYTGQAIIHTSGLLGPEVLLPALAAGTQAGSFHPLVAFADVERAVAALHGATIAIEGDDDLAALLADMAEAVGGDPVRLAPGSKAVYHAAAVLAAGGVTAMLDTIRELAAVLGLDEEGALRVYLPLLEQTVGNARALGVAAALTGPATRGDAGTIAAHLEALARSAPAAAPVYAALMARQVDLAERRGALSPERAQLLRTALASKG